MESGHQAGLEASASPNGHSTCFWLEKDAKQMRRQERIAMLPSINACGNLFSSFPARHPEESKNDVRRIELS